MKMRIRNPHFQRCLCTPLEAMNGKDQLLITDEPAEFEKILVEVQNFGNFKDHFRDILIFRISIKKSERRKDVSGWTWKHSDLDRLCPKISPDIGWEALQCKIYSFMLQSLTMGIYTFPLPTLTLELEGPWPMLYNYVIGQEDGDGSSLLYSRSWGHECLITSNIKKKSTQRLTWSPSG